MTRVAANVHYPVNQKKGMADNVAGTGIGSCIGGNNPLVSAHPGGVNVLLGDGSVRLLADTSPLLLLAELATRDDGQPLPSF